MRKVKGTLSMLALAASGLALVVAATRTSTPGAAVKKERTAIEHVLLFDGTRFVNDATVVMRAGRIERVCTGCDAPDDAEIVDGRGKTLLPGLIDAHTHVYGDALERALQFGVTTEIDMFTAHQFAAKMREEQKKGSVTSRADLVSAGTLVTVEGGHGTEYGMKIPTFAAGDDAQKFVDDRIAEGSDFIKLVEDDGHLFGLKFATLDAASLRRLVDAAHARGKPAVVHVSTAGGARMAAEAGADGLAHGWSDTLDEDVVKLIAAKKMFVIPTLSVIGSIAGETTGADLLTSATFAKRMRSGERAALQGHFPFKESGGRLAVGLEVVQALRRNGVRLLAGTDAPNPGTTHGASLHSELSLLVRAGMSTAEALAAATSVPAKTFALQDRGTVAEGKRADLLLVDGDVSRDIRATRSIVSIWRNGVRVEAVSDAAAKRFAAGTVSDFNENLGSAFGRDWVVSTDSYAGGKSVADLQRSVRGTLEVKGEIRPGFASPWAGAMLFFAPQPMDAVDLRPATAISFRVRGDSPIRLMVFSKSTGPMPASYDVPVSDAWREVKVTLDQLGVSAESVQAIHFSGTKEHFAFELDDVAIR